MKMRMIKLLTLSGIAATTIATSSKAQGATINQKPPVTFYIKGGYNAANISTQNDGSVKDANALSTFHAGVITDIPLAPVFSIQTGLMLNGQGAKTNYYLSEDDKSDNYVKTRFNPLYLQLPVNAVVKFPLSKTTRIYAGAGTYAEMGIGGKQKAETSFAGIQASSSDNIKFDNDDPTTGEEEGARYDRLKKFDLGVNALAGVEFNRFSFGVNYGIGLTKINSTQHDNDNDNNKYRTFSVGVGVRL